MIKKFESFDDQHVAEAGDIITLLPNLKEGIIIGDWDTRMFNYIGKDYVVIRISNRDGYIINVDGLTWYIPFQCAEIKGSKKRIKIRRPDIDPFDEEDWGWEEVNESMSDNFKVGDTVELSDKRRRELKRQDSKFINIWIVGEVKYTYYDYNKEQYVTVDWGEDTTTHYSESLKLINKRTKMRRPDIDPFDEEDWGYIQESLDEKIKIGDRVICIGPGGRCENKSGNVVGFGSNSFSIGIEFDEYMGFVQEDIDNQKFKIGDIVELTDDRKMSVDSFWLDKWKIGKVIRIYQNDSYPIKVDWNGDITTHARTSLKLYDNNKKRTKIRRPDIDPFDEEDWGYVQESLSKKFKIGDRVRLNKKITDELKRVASDDWFKRHETGIIIGLRDGDMYENPSAEIRWEPVADPHNRFWEIGEIEHSDNKKRIKIRRPDIDPFDEEDWGYVQEGKKDLDTNYIELRPFYYLSDRGRNIDRAMEILGVIVGHKIKFHELDNKTKKLICKNLEYIPTIVGGRLVMHDSKGNAHIIDQYNEIGYYKPIVRLITPEDPWGEEIWD